jgi:hypothetical protein
MTGSLQYRDAKRRYPWWVKAVQQPTTESDLEKTDPATPLGLIGNPESINKVNVGWEQAARQIRSGAPGRNLRDSALHWAFSTYFTRKHSPFALEGSEEQEVLRQRLQQRRVT